MYIPQFVSCVINPDGASFFNANGTPVRALDCHIYGDPELVEINVGKERVIVEYQAFIETEKYADLTYEDVIREALSQYGIDVRFVDLPRSIDDGDTSYCIKVGAAFIVAMGIIAGAFCYGYEVALDDVTAERVETILSLE